MNALAYIWWHSLPCATIHPYLHHLLGVLPAALESDRLQRRGDRKERSEIRTKWRKGTSSKVWREEVQVTIDG